MNHRNPLHVRSTFTVIQCTVRGTVYYESLPQQSFILQVELEVETLLDSILYFKRSIREYIHHFYLDHVTVAL